MKKLLTILIIIFYSVCCYAQAQKSKAIELPYNEFYTWYQNPVLKALNNEAWTVTMINEPPDFAAKQIQYFYVQAERQTQVGVKSKVSVLFNDGKMSIWFVQISADGATKPITEQNLNEEEKSLFEELRKVSKTK
jgi:hypothetical protein